MADGSNNLIIFYTLLFFFILLGSVLPLFNSEYGTSESEKSIDGPGDTSGLSFLYSLLTVAFWSFNVNVWINLILLEPFRILFYITIYRILNPLA